MARKFTIQFRQSNGNLHFSPLGVLDGSSAWELINLIKSKYNGQGNVFIETKGLTEIWPFAGQILKCRLDSRVVPRKNLIFKGEKGHEIAPEGCRVLVILQGRSCACKHQCNGCSCRAGREIERI